jgi:dienelactone hydrolase
MNIFKSLLPLGWMVAAAAAPGQEGSHLPGTAPLQFQGDLSARMVEGISQFLDRQTEASVAGRAAFWRRDFSSHEAYEASVQPNRERLRRIIGAVDERGPVTALEYVSTTDSPARVVETELFGAFAVRWPVFEDVSVEGLLLRPKGAPLARLVVIPDADQTPETLAGLAPGLAPEGQVARRLAENGCLVLVLALVDRSDTWSGNPRLNRFTNQPHREWIYRQAFEVGRHLIGYEVQAVLAAVDWLLADAARGAGGKPARVGVAGHGEGALVALYAAALDPRIGAALVSGYFDSRQALWAEPIYRNVFGLLREFGDAEVASLVAPRALVIEHSQAPRIQGPPKPRQGRSGAAPGAWRTPDFNTVDAEVRRAGTLAGPFKDFVRFHHANEGATLGPGDEGPLLDLLAALGHPLPQLRPPGPAPKDERGTAFDPAARQKRLVGQWVEHTQRILRACESHRDRAFWQRLQARSAGEWAAAAESWQSNFWDDVIGRLPRTSVPPNPRSRKIVEQPKWTGYDVMLDVWPEVFAWGVLLLPKDLKPGERRPVVVCQHGLEGVPADTFNEDPKSGAYGAYKAFAARLAERGFVVFAPHNPYRGGDRFRVLQRKANPIGCSLFSVILGQHERLLEWLGAQPFADPKRIGFYGLSYGGKTAMRVPALLDGYCISICSADFNEWVRKNATVDSAYSYLFTGEYEIVEWDLGHTFNYAEMAALIAPRPFMVERGHDDGVAPDEWVAHEFARVRRFYDKLGIGERAAVEFFNGPHTIHGVGTFQFLHRHLDRPEPR